MHSTCYEETEFNFEEKKLKMKILFKSFFAFICTLVHFRMRVDFMSRDGVLLS